MSEGSAIIIAAVITVGGMVITVLANILVNNCQRKAEFNERLFFDAYQKRLALYEDVINALSAMGKPESDLNKMSKQEFSDKAMADFHALVVLFNRLRLFGSPGARSIMAEAVSRMKEIFGELNDRPSIGLELLSDAVSVEPLAYAIGSFMLLVNDSLSEFTKLVHAETGTNLADKRLGEIQKEFAAKKTDKNPGGDSDVQKRKHQGKRSFGKDKVQ